MASDGDTFEKLHRKLRAFFLGLCLISLPALANAKNNCTWLNEATASGFLGGDAVGEFTEAQAGQPAVCVFTFQDSGARRTLRITVEVAADPQTRLTEVQRACGTDAAPIKAIGNEALVCSADERKGALGERVVGRVRDQIFTITISSSLKDDPILTRDALKSRVYTAAEQVAGNLF